MKIVYHSRTQHGIEREFADRAEAEARLNFLDESEANDKKHRPTDSGGVRHRRLQEADALRAALHDDTDVKEDINHYARKAKNNDDAVAAFEEHVNDDVDVKCDDPHQIEADFQLKALTAGNATVTIKSKSTGERRTFKIKAKDGEEDVFFVQLLTGSDNSDWRSYSYLGLMTRDKSTGLLDIRLTAKSCVKERSSVAYLAIAWTLRQLQTKPQNVASQVEVWHEGRCCACNRKLTVPESIKSGFGPRCLANLG
jgi:hypothetical protein